MSRARIRRMVGAATGVTPRAVAALVFAAATMAPIFLGGCRSPGPSGDPGSPAASQGPKAPPPPVRAQPRRLTDPLSVRDAIEIALERQPDIDAAVARIQQADAMAREAKAVFLPGIYADTSYIRGDAPSSYLFKKIDARRLPPATDFNRPGTFENFESGLTIRYNLFSGGTDSSRLQSASAARAASLHDREAVENALIASVIRAYYDALAAGEHVKAMEESLKTVTADLEETRKREVRGAALRSDVLSLNVRRAEADENLIRARNGHALALATLAHLMGLRSDSPIELSGAEWKPREVPADYGTALGIALDTRPELKRAHLALLAAGYRGEAARGGFLPRIDLMARGYYDDADMAYRAGDGNWFMGVSLEWGLFEGGRTRAEVARATAEQRELTARLRKAALGVELEVKRAYLDLEAARARIEVTRAAEAEAGESLKMVKSQFEAGAATVTRYLEAEAALTLARVRGINAAYDVKKATAEVGRALGWCGTCAREEGLR